MTDLIDASAQVTSCCCSSWFVSNYERLISYLLPICVKIPLWVLPWFVLTLAMLGCFIMSCYSGGYHPVYLGPVSLRFSMLYKIWQRITWGRALRFATTECTLYPPPRVHLYWSFSVLLYAVGFYIQSSTKLVFQVVDCVHVVHAIIDPQT